MANKVSQRRAAARSQDTVLLGQVRYPWITMVGGSAKQGWIENDSPSSLLASNPEAKVVP